LVSLLAEIRGESETDGSHRRARGPARKIHRRRHAQHLYLSGDIEVTGAAKKFSALVALGLSLASIPARAQGLDPAKMLKPPTDTWPTFNGDYTGRRFSPLTQINTTNAGKLSLAWAFQARTTGMQAMPLEVNGILYIAGGNQGWAIDARTGHQVW